MICSVTRFQYDLINIMCWYIHMSHIGVRCRFSSRDSSFLISFPQFTIERNEYIHWLISERKYVWHTCISHSSDIHARGRTCFLWRVLFTVFQPFLVSRKGTFDLFDTNSLDGCTFMVPLGSFDTVVVSYLLSPDELLSETKFVWWSVTLEALLEIFCFIFRRWIDYPELWKSSYFSV